MDIQNALLLVGPDCPHCATMLETMSTLIKEGTIGRLEIVNVAKYPEVASTYGVRSVPWLKIEIMEFQGVYTIQHIRQWLNEIQLPDGIAKYFAWLLEGGHLNNVIKIVSENQETLKYITALLNTHQDLKIRLGISAVFEELQGNELLNSCTDDLIQIINSHNNNARADAAYLLSMIKNQKAMDFLHLLTKDENKDVREIAMDAINNEI